MTTDPTPPDLAAVPAGGTTEGCRACDAPVATLHAAPGGPVLLCPSCAAEHDLGCP